MEITITIAGPSKMRLAFPYNPLVVAFVKGLPGASFDGKPANTWTVPVTRWEELDAKFGAYLYPDYDVHVALDDRPRVFAQNLIDLGVDLYLDGERVIASGAGVSPLLQQEVDARAEAIAWLIRAGKLTERTAGVTLKPWPAPAAVVDEYTARMDAILVKGIANARKAEEKREQRQAQAKAARQQKGTFQWNQASLIE